MRTGREIGVCEASVGRLELKLWAGRKSADGLRSEPGNHGAERPAWVAQATARVAREGGRGPGGGRDWRPSRTAFPRVSNSVKSCWGENCLWNLVPRR